MHLVETSVDLSEKQKALTKKYLVMLKWCGSVVEQRTERQTCYQGIVGLTSDRGAAVWQLGASCSHVCAHHQAVYFGTS